MPAKKTTAKASARSGKTTQKGLLGKSFKLSNKRVQFFVSILIIGVIGGGIALYRSYAQTPALSLNLGVSLNTTPNLTSKQATVVTETNSSGKKPIDQAVVEVIAGGGIGYNFKTLFPGKYEGCFNIKPLTSDTSGSIGAQLRGGGFQTGTNGLQLNVYQEICMGFEVTSTTATTTNTDLQSVGISIDKGKARINTFVIRASTTNFDQSSLTYALTYNTGNPSFNLAKLVSEPSTYGYNLNVVELGPSTSTQSGAVTYKFTPNRGIKYDVCYEVKAIRLPAAGGVAAAPSSQTIRGGLPDATNADLSYTKKCTVVDGSTNSGEWTTTFDGSGTWRVRSLTVTPQ